MRLFLSIVYIAVIGILSHFIGEALPRRWFDPRRAPYAPWGYERDGRFYRALRVQAWKDKLPDMSKISSRMVGKRVSLTGSSEEARRVAVETCVAEVVHLALIPLAAPVYLICPTGPGLALAIVYALSNLPFIIIQRYNRPTLLTLAERLKQREERIKHAHTDSVGQHR